MKPLFIFTVITIAIVTKVCACGDWLKSEYISIEKRNYWIGVSNDLVEKSPKWTNPEKKPPLKSYAAIKLAREHMENKHENSASLKVTCIALKPFTSVEVPDRWYYAIQFSDRLNPSESPKPVIIVMMNGKILSAMEYIDANQQVDPIVKTPVD